jgi:hypothetical protein
MGQYSPAPLLGARPIMADFTARSRILSPGSGTLSFLSGRRSRCGPRPGELH